MRGLVSMEEAFIDGTAIDRGDAALVAYLGSFGIEAVEVPNDMDTSAFGDADIVVLSGAGRFRGQPERDAVEHDLIEYAVDRDLPVLAFGRGMQLMNVHFGGSVTEDAELAVPRIVGGIHPAEGGTWLVNHDHVDAVRLDDVMPPMQILMKDTDNGTVEALHNPYLRLLGFQFRPERPMPPAAQERMRALISLALKNGGFL